MKEIISQNLNYISEELDSRTSDNNLELKFTSKINSKNISPSHKNKGSFKDDLMLNMSAKSRKESDNIDFYNPMLSPIISKD